MNSIKDDKFISSLLKKIPSDQRDSFSEEQLQALKIALGARTWGIHGLDLRGTLGVGKWSFYYVILAGRNKRQKIRNSPISKAIKSIFITTFLIFSTLLGLLVIYLIKSALGIDLIPGFSLGIWGKFQQYFL